MVSTKTSAAKIAESWIQGLKSKDFSRVPLAPEVTFESPFTGGLLKGADTIKKFLSTNIFPVTRDCRVKQTMLEGDSVCIIWDFQTTSDVVVPICEYFRVSNGKITAARPYFDPSPVVNAAATARKALLKSVTEAYFEGIAEKDMSSVPYDDNVVLRSPLGPKGIDHPMVGRQAVLDWFASLWPVVGETQVWEHYFNEDLTIIATRADITITKPLSKIRVTDRFAVSAEGKITQQENHYDAKGASASVASAF
jgi:limonene-1,2-epoxide hydrolase